ncbi:unnamed protein product [Linum tenue]|uniref:Transmembrane protein 220 n=2 Tax=Linum tenue TaxID=586396 RepID=A0AAV0R8P3_9ROSI|nr:unnamed protein product [Linum tenue]
MATSTKLFTLCSGLMGALFAYSASVQLNDPDWYFWFPLYTGACAVNLMNVAAATSNPVSRRIAEVTLWAALFLFCKVVVEDLATGTAGLWSLDLRERVVREKIGSGMVFVSMVLHFKAFPLPEAEGKKKGKEHGIPRHVEYGMLGLVVFSFGLPSVFFRVMGGGEMKFE